MKIVEKLKRTAKEAQYTEDAVQDEEWIRVDGKLVKVEASHEDAEKGQ